MRQLVIFIIFFFATSTHAQNNADELIQRVRAKLEKINSYEADAQLKTNVSFIKAPIAHVKVYYAKPDKLRIINQNGISFIPKGTVNINLGSVIMANQSFDILDVGRDPAGWRIIKLLPKEDTGGIVLSTLYIDEKNSLIRKSRTTTKENGSYELEMTYGKYADFGLPDKIVFSFNTKEYKLPKGATLDYDNGGKKNENKLKNKRGTIEITYRKYIINKASLP